jgi:hypothetical protein
MTMEDAKKLQIGQKLVVPGKGTPKQADSQKNVKTETADKPETPQKKVEEKDANLDSANEIAKKIEENSADDKNKENFEGGTDPYELSEDTTFQELAAKLNIPEATLRRLNPEFTGDNLPKDNCVMIPAKK